MAITRCPYCHAIIDENDKHCNNCGTQLLFPEDEEIEEDIPGEKIIDAETEEKDYEIDEPEGEARTAKDEDSEDELSEEPVEGTGEIDLKDLIEEETVKTAGLDEPEEDEEEEQGEEEGREDEVEASGQIIVLDEAELAADTGEIFPKEQDLVTAADAEPEEAVPTPPAAEAVPPTFDTIELEGMGKTVELGKDKIDQLLDALAESKTEEEKPREEIREPPGTLPPWASVMKGAPAFSEGKDTDELERKGEEKGPWEVGEEEIFPRKKPSDSTIGFPERVTQSPLLFEAVEEEEVEQDAGEEPVAEEPADEQAVEEAAEEGPRGFLRADRREVPPAREPEPEDVEAAEERAAPGERPPFNITAYLKSKAFDVLFVGLFWLVALWLAAHAVGATLFGILAAMSGSMVLLYAVFVLLYFFFFKFFLGETLGERLFRRRE